VKYIKLTINPAMIAMTTTVIANEYGNDILYYLNV